MVPPLEFCGTTLTLIVPSCIPSNRPTCGAFGSIVSFLVTEAHFRFLVLFLTVFLPVVDLVVGVTVFGEAAVAALGSAGLSVEAGLSAGLSVDGGSAEDCIVQASARAAARAKPRPQGDTTKRRIMEQTLSEDNLPANITAD